MNDTKIFQKGIEEGDSRFREPSIYFEETENGYWIQSFNGHSSCIGYISIWGNRVSVKWTGTATYWYAGVNVEKVLATLLLTQSLGKVANYIKRTGTVTHKFDAEVIEAGLVDA
tara:strand:- start:1448 stop:1789 length:342 start_codon:yes stop_codon:yes gene_type:complete